jgi:hypothetical protein
MASATTQRKTSDAWSSSCVGKESKAFGSTPSRTPRTPMT